MVIVHSKKFFYSAAVRNDRNRRKVRPGSSCSTGSSSDVTPNSSRNSSLESDFLDSNLSEEVRELISNIRNAHLETASNEEVIYIL